MSDRLKGPIQALARRSDPLALYARLYRARVLAQSGDLLRVDVSPEDPLLPPMSNIPLRHGIPGLTVSMAPGAILMVGWENSRPDLPFAALWANPTTSKAANAKGTSGSAGSGAVLSVSIGALIVELGTDGATPLLPLDGVLTGRAIDPFTGLPHFALGNASTHVMAKKV